MLSSHLPFTLLSLLFAFPRTATAQNLSSSQVNTIKSQLSSFDLQSWEIGTYAQALLELDTPSWSTLTPGVHFPSVASSSPPDSLGEVLNYAKSVAQNWTTANNVTSANANTVVAPLLKNSAAGDPPSTGFALILANLTGQSQADNLSYAAAATSQLEYLLTKVPKTDDGAISHRPEQLQLWADFVYMVPPFLASYGIATGNASVARMAWDQIRMYRAYLRDNSTQTSKTGQTTAGLWRHMAFGKGPDEGLWSTGNAWAAAGMVRVLGLYAASPFASDLQTEQADLAQWAQEIQSALGGWLDPQSTLLHNYANDSTTFTDAASTTLFAASVYRLETLLNSGVASKAKSSDGTSVSDIAKGARRNVPVAEHVRSAVLTTPSGSTGSGLAHFTADMALMPVVNGHNFGAQLSLPVASKDAIPAANDGLAFSPEGQAFVLNLQAAYRDWAGAGSPAQNAACAVRGGSFPRGALYAAVAAGCVLLQ